MADVTRREAVQLAAATGLAALGASVVHADHGTNAALPPVDDLPIFLSIEKGVTFRSGDVRLVGGKSYKMSDAGFPFKWVHDAAAKRYKLSLAPFEDATLAIEDTKKAFTTYIVASKGCHLYVNLIPDDRKRSPELCCIDCHGVTICDVPPFWVDCHGWLVCCLA
jgi:hypothetical protein